MAMIRAELCWGLRMGEEEEVKNFMTITFVGGLYSLSHYLSR